MGKGVISAEPVDGAGLVGRGRKGGGGVPLSNPCYARNFWPFPFPQIHSFGKITGSHECSVLIIRRLPRFTDAGVGIGLKSGDSEI